MIIKFLKFGFFAILFATTLFVTACGETATESDDTNTTEQTEGEEADSHEEHEQNEKEEHSETSKNSKKHSSAYVCPMHCEGSGSDTEGKCPVCGMDYVALADHEEDGHTHE